MFKRILCIFILMFHSLLPIGTFAATANTQAALAYIAVPTSNVSLSLLTATVSKVVQISFPVVYGPNTFVGKFFSRIQVCNTGDTGVLSSLIGNQDIPVTIDVIPLGSNTAINSLNVTIPINTCIKYTSANGHSSDPLLGAVPSGVYQVKATVQTTSVATLLGVLLTYGNLNGQAESLTNLG